MDGRHLYVVERSIPEWLWWIQTSSVTCIVRPIVTVQRHVQNGFVVITDLHRDVHVSVVAVIYPSEEVITVEVARMGSKFQMVVRKLQRTITQCHCL